jgi:hypothetical protein
MKYDSQGKKLWQINHEGWPATAFAVDLFGNIVVPGAQHGLGWSTIALTKYTQGLSSNTIPADIQLRQSFPNPFANATAIRYAIPGPVKVAVKIYNALGEEIETLIDAEHAAGEHTLLWAGNDLANGLYFVRLQAGAVVKTKKIVLVR